MVKLTKIQEYGNQLLALFDDGSRVLAYPTMGGMWVASDNGGGSGPGTGEFMFPFDVSTISSEYGPRTGGTGTFHEGTDFAPAGGTPIPAIGDGNGSENYYHANFGNMLIIDHGTLTTGTYSGKQCRSLYAHMENPSPVGVSDPVSKGDTVGTVGNTGASQGAHLHLEIHITDPGDPIVWNTNDDGGYRSAVNARTFLDEYSV